MEEKAVIKIKRSSVCGAIKHDRQYMYKRNTQTHSRNYCFRGKAISITYSECVFVALGNPACNSHAPILSSVTYPFLQYFSAYLINATIFEKEN